MSNLRDSFEKIKNNNNPDEINDFLIKIGNNPHLDYLSFLSYFITDIDPDIHEKIKINLVYALGELGKIEEVDDKHIDYLINEYYKSDRWVRNEVIIAFNKISTQLLLAETVIRLIGKSLNEDYTEIKKNALEALLHIDNIPKQVLENVLHILNSENTELENLGSNILKKNIFNEKDLFDLLNTSANYKILKKKGLRVLLIDFFNSLNYLERFKARILKTEDWDDIQKSIFLAEIDIFERILLKNI